MTTKNNVTTKQLAKVLHISTFRVRRVLRSIRNDKKYTRYSIPPSVQARVREKVNAVRKPVRKATLKKAA